MIPGLGRSTGEGVGYPLQYSWASLVVQLVKNPPAMWETWVRSLCWKDPLEKGTATHSSIPACRILSTVKSVGSCNKASGGDGIPVDLFQILRDDAVKVLHSICQQIWKTQQWPQDWKRSVFIPVPKKRNAKESSNYHSFIHPTC